MQDQEIAKIIPRHNPHLTASEFIPTKAAALMPAAENFVKKGRPSRARHRLPRVGCGRTPYFRRCPSRFLVSYKCRGEASLHISTKAPHSPSWLHGRESLHSPLSASNLQLTLTISTVPDYPLTSNKSIDTKDPSIEPTRSFGHSNTEPNVNGPNPELYSQQHVKSH
jgi:hypothetical protein